MDQLLSKLTNLSYEILGIFVPGVVLILFAVFGWWCLGPMASFWSQGFLPTAEIVVLSSFLDLLNDGIRVGMLFFIGVAAYFAGHLLHWMSRRGERLDDIGNWRRIRLSLAFKVPKPATDFHAPLAKLFQEVKPVFRLSPQAEWREYYPVAKSYLAMTLQSSLAPTYQTKYTLHRSLTIASAVWFWGTAFGIAASLFSVWVFNASDPKWIPLAGSLLISVILIGGFSDTYRYNWLLWGDTLISEVYMLNRAPK